MSGEHELKLATLSRTPPPSPVPKTSEEAAVKVARETGRLVDVVQEEIRWVRRTLYLAIALVVASQLANHLTIRSVASRIDVTPGEVKREVRGVRTAVEILRDNQSDIDEILEGVRRMTAGLVEAEAAELEPDPKRYEQAVERVQEARQEAEAVFDGSKP